MMTKEGTFQLQCGVVLDLVRISTPAMRHAIIKFGLTGLATQLSSLTTSDKKEWNTTGRTVLNSMSTKQQDRFIEGLDSWAAFMLGWGVSTNPPQSTVNELNALGLGSDSERALRANWIQFYLVKTEEELAELLGVIMAYSSTPEVEPEQGDDNADEVKALKRRIAELEQQAAVEGEQVAQEE